MTFASFMEMLTVGERRDLLDWLERCIVEFSPTGKNPRESRCAALTVLLAELERA